MEACNFIVKKKVIVRFTEMEGNTYKSTKTVQNDSIHETIKNNQNII